ncbi:hypothetical protein C0992_012685 [Termitomyces sp. T32_za158]|nr:hypothetical protein C0992_012685 [Termitomyces sp. T32_za158]
MSLSKTIEPAKRYQSSSRKILIDINRRHPIRLKKKRIKHKKTTAEKEEAKTKRETERNTYLVARNAAADLLHAEAAKLHQQFGGHTIQWYKEDILQTAHLKGEKRGVS